ncbi:MAG: FtsX-like permease family protein [Nocardioides sp.]
MIRLWLAGLLRRRAGRLVATGFGIAVAVALIGSLGSFLSASEATMTQRAAGGVAVDWQVAVHPHAGKGTGAVLSALRRDPATVAALPVRFATTSRLQATTSGTTQTTGAGQVLGLASGYAHAFPQAIRVLTGNLSGAVVAQQTAANLHVQPGDRVRIARAGRKPASVTVTGVVELPQADSLFQRVGAPPQSQAVAPPDNVVLLPSATFASTYAGAPAADHVTTQIHVARDRALPPAPDTAYVADSGQARHLEAATSGVAVVGDNLGAVLDSAREDAAYARILFLFLAAPGVVLAGALTAAVTQAGAERRRDEQRLLRSRGSSTAQLLRMVLAEGALIGLGGGIAGLGAALVIGRVAFGSFGFGAGFGAAAAWDGLALLVGLVIAALVIVVPARRQLARSEQVRQRGPRWLRWGLDLLLIAVALGVFWASGRNKYTLVLAPEGVPTISVSYWTFLAPALAWIGAALLSWRLADLLLGRGRRLLASALRPVAGNLAPMSAAMLSRQRGTVAQSGVLVGLALSFAISTAVFNATYHQQAEADAQLTNGADVTVAAAPGQALSASYVAKLGQLPGVKAAVPMQHRFAYVGADLQDLYGINPSTIQQATTLQNPYFQGATAAQELSRLAAQPDGVLVSAETVNDYQLNLGDKLILRLQNATDHSYTPVSFHYVGIVNEFPTAPKDSFIVADQAYVGQQTHNTAPSTILVNTGGANVASTAAATRSLVGSDGQVQTINDARGLVGSSLTSVDLAGLTRLELAFALVIAASAGGLVMGLGLTERRRSIAVASALGASRRQLRRLVTGEPLIVSLVGVVAGALSGWGLSELLVKVLTGVFDPPPAALAVPWAYLLAVAVCACGAVGAASAWVAARTRRDAQQILRQL